MSAHDVLDVLNVQRDDLVQPAKKKAKTETVQIPKSGISRELYNLIGANTPPILVNMGNNRLKDRKLRVSPWTRMPFVPNQRSGKAPTLHHWEKGAKELLTETSKDKPYYFDKYVVSVDIPELVDEEFFEKFMTEIVDDQKQRSEKINAAAKLADKAKEAASLRSTKPAPAPASKPQESKKEDPSKSGLEDVRVKEEEGSSKEGENSDVKIDEKGAKELEEVAKALEEGVKVPEKEAKDLEKLVLDAENDESEPHNDGPSPWTYEETKLLFQYCKDFELKWFVINDRFPRKYNRSLEDLKEQFYAMCHKIMTHKSIGNPSLIDALKGYSKPDEIERKEYLLNLLKRTPTEIAEESLLVIEARRFEIAAKKMLMERANLLTLLDLPQADPAAQNFQSSQGLGNLYSQLMILNKDRKKSQHKLSLANSDPVPPPIPMAASSSHKRDFQTHLQQYLSGHLKQQGVKLEDNAIQQLLAKKLTVKEEEAYGLHYHANDRINPGVILRSTQRLSGLQQRQSVFKAVNSMLQEMDIPTAGGTTWKPNMPTRKTMAKYDELTRTVVALLDVKKSKDKLEAEIELIKSQRGL